MASKLAAARMATWSGVTTVIAPARAAHALRQALEGAPVSARRFTHEPERLSARKSWIAFARGEPGLAHDQRGRAPRARARRAKPAARGRRCPPRGSFVEGDAVEVKGPEGGSSPRVSCACRPSRSTTATTSSCTATTSSSFDGPEVAPLRLIHDDERVERPRAPR